MKYILVLFLILNGALPANAQKHPTSQDSIKVFYDAIFSKMQEGYLHKDSVNWQTVKAETETKLSTYSDFKKALNELVPLFSKIGATHSAVQYEDKKYSISVKFSPERFTDQWKKKFAEKPNLQVKIIDNQYGYILMPALNFLDTRPKNVNKIAQHWYDQINTLTASKKLKGWIIDLRFNTGGNSWPMLLSLYDFLGDHDISATLDGNKKQKSMASLSNGNYLVNSEKQFHIKPNGFLLDQAKVAIIIGAVTASSGEVVAMAFKDRPNTVFIGENSAGFTSANFGEKLPFGAVMILSKEYNSDRNGNYFDHVVPDIPVSKQDNFDDLLQDGNIQQAIKFIKS